MKSRWQLQEARNQLSQVIQNALRVKPQIITRHGKDAVVVVSISEWSQYAAKRKKLVEVLRECPVPDFKFPKDRDHPKSVELKSDRFTIATGGYGFRSSKDIPVTSQPRGLFQIQE